MSLLLTLKIFHRVSIVTFKQVNTGWDILIKSAFSPTLTSFQKKENPSNYRRGDFFIEELFPKDKNESEMNHE